MSYFDRMVRRRMEGPRPRPRVVRKRGPDGIWAEEWQTLVRFPDQHWREVFADLVEMKNRKPAKMKRGMRWGRVGQRART